MNMHEILIAAHDAAALRNLLDTLEHLDRMDAAAEAMDALLDGVRIMDVSDLPEGTVTLEAGIDYQELPSGAARTISLVLPERADAGEGRISVLSPVGRALLGRRAGATSEASLPGGRNLGLRIVAVRSAGEVLPA